MGAVLVLQDWKLEWSRSLCEDLWPLMSGNTGGFWFSRWPDFHWMLKAAWCLLSVSRWCEQVAASLSTDERAESHRHWVLEPWACSPANLVWTGGWWCLRVATQNFKHVKKAFWIFHCHTHTPRERACCSAPKYHASRHLISNTGSVSAYCTWMRMGHLLLEVGFL